jgi:hypothetical protein
MASDKGGQPANSDKHKNVSHTLADKIWFVDHAAKHPNLSAVDLGYAEADHANTNVPRDQIPTAPPGNTSMCCDQFWASLLETTVQSGGFQVPGFNDSSCKPAAGRPEPPKTVE